MIENLDKVGDFEVNMYALKNLIATFQCPTINDVKTEIEKITRQRNLQNLPTAKVKIYRIIGKNSNGIIREKFNMG